MTRVDYNDTEAKMQVRGELGMREGLLVWTVKVTAARDKHSLNKKGRHQSSCDRKGSSIHMYNRFMKEGKSTKKRKHCSDTYKEFPEKKSSARQRKRKHFRHCLDFLSRIKGKFLSSFYTLGRFCD